MAYRSSSSTTFTGTSNLTATAPAGVTAGDRLLALLVQAADSQTYTPATGWTEIAAEASQPTPQDQRYVIAEKKVAAGGGADQYNFTSVTSTSAAMVSVVCLSGRHATQEAVVSAVTNNQTNNATPFSVALSGATALDGDDVLWLAQLNHSVSTDRWGYSALTNYTEREDSSANFITNAIYTREAVAAGATGTLTATATRASGTGTAWYGGWVVAVPAVAAAVAPSVGNLFLRKRRAGRRGAAFKKTAAAWFGTLLVPSGWFDPRIIPHAGAAGLTASVAQVSETDTAQAIARLKGRSVGQVVESDLAQAISSRKARAIGQVVEADTAQAIDRRKTRTLTQVSETDTAQAIARLKTRAVAQVNEADTAQPIARNKGLALGQAVEADTAQPITPAGAKIVAVAQVTEADTAQPIARRKAKALAQVLEADSAQAIAARKTRSVAQVSETDSAQAIERRKARTLAQTTETDTAQAITPSGTKVIAVAQVTEADSAQPITRRKLRSVTQVLEADTAQPVQRLKLRSVSLVLEIDTAQLIQWAPKRRRVNQVLETDTAQAISAQTGELPALPGYRSAPITQTARRADNLAGVGRLANAAVGRSNATVAQRNNLASGRRG